MKLILFEDLQARDFYPLGETRPVWELRTGLGTLRRRIEWRLDMDAEGGLCRGELQGVAARLGLPVPELESDEDVLLVNARLLEFDPEEILALDQGQGILDGDVLIAARLVASGLDDMEEGGPELDVIEAACDPILAERVWDLVHHLKAGAESDYLLLEARRLRENMTAPPESVDHSVRILGAERVHVEAGAEIAPYCVLDGRNGPIVIESGAKIASFCVIEGPAYIGEDCRLKPSTRLLGGNHLGPCCRVAGEVGESILQGFANKQHDGFLGHAYLGEWTNLGADTNNSDLKNNYGDVSVCLKGETINTGLRFVGLMMGDHSKTGINTMFNTGTVVGPFANIWGGGFPPKEVPPFSWGGPQDAFVPYELEKALAVAATVKGRRDRQLGREERELFRHMHEQYQSLFDLFSA